MGKRGPKQTREDRLFDELLDPMHRILTSEQTLENLEYMQGLKRKIVGMIRNYGDERAKEAR